eukprot:457870_1
MSVADTTSEESLIDTTTTDYDDVTTTEYDDVFEPCIEEYISFSNTIEITIKITINKKLNKMNIILEGPNDKWFGIGFGSDKMENTYAIIVFDAVENIQERILGNHLRGNEIVNSFDSVNYISLSGRRIVSLIRDYKINSNSNVYDFTQFCECNITQLNVILAIGRELPFGYHGEYLSVILKSCSDTNIVTTKSTEHIITDKPTEDVNEAVEVLFFTYMYSILISIVITMFVFVL